MDPKVVGHCIFLLFKGLTYGVEIVLGHPFGLNQTNEFINFIIHGVIIKTGHGHESNLLYHVQVRWFRIILFG